MYKYVATVVLHWDTCSTLPKKEKNNKQLVMFVNIKKNNIYIQL
jgi:hypothetical protein